MKRLLLTAFAAVASAALAEGTFHWTGAEDGRWNNPNNWKEGAVPGVVWDGETGTPSLPTGDTAVFGASQHATVDLSGLYSIGAVKVEGTDAPAYVFGSGATQVLPIEPGGMLEVAAGVPVAPVVQALSVQANLASKDHNRPITVRNDSAGQICLRGLGEVVWRPGATSAWFLANVLFRGDGGVRFDCGAISNLRSASLSLTFHDRGAYAVTSDLSGFIQLNVQAGSECRFVLPEGKTMSFNKSTSNGIRCESGGKVVFDGPGKFVSHDIDTGTSYQNRGMWVLNAGSSVTFNCPLEVSPRNGDWASHPNPEWWIGQSSGVLSVNGVGNVLKGPLHFVEKSCVTFAFPSVSALDAMPGVIFASKREDSAAPKFAYAGRADETFSGWLNVTNDHAYSVQATKAGGVLRVNSEIRADAVGANATLTFDAVAGRIVYGCALAGGPSPHLVFAGRGGVTIGASAQFPPEGVTLDNAVVSVTEARSLPKVRVGTSSCDLVLSGTLTNEIESIEVAAGGTLNVRTSGGARLRLRNATAATTLPGVLLNGETPHFQADGLMVFAPTAVDRTIAARGDAIPHAPAQKVGIATAGAGGPDTLEMAATEVAALVQQSAVDAVVALDDGQSLAAGLVAVDDGAHALTLGVAAGQGVLSADELRNASADVPLTVNARLGLSTWKKTGGGDLALRGGAATATGVSLEGGVTRLEGGTYRADADKAVVVKDGAALIVEKGAQVLRTGNGQTLASGTSTIDVFDGSFVIAEGAVVSNRVVAGATDNSRVGLIRQSGGFFANTGASSGTLNFLCVKGYQQGGFLLEGGTAVFTNSVAIGGNVSQAVIEQTGGTMRHAGGPFRLGVDRNCNAVFTMTGGTNDFGTLNIRDWGNVPNVHAVVNVEGPSACFRCSETVQMGYENRDANVTNTFGYLNLNAGVFSCPRITRITDDGKDRGTLDRERSKMFINFNGGTLQTCADVGDADDAAGGLFGDYYDQARSNWIDRVYVYERGATIRTDAEDREVTVRNPLRAPTGKGVWAVAMSEEVAAKVSRVPPFVKVLGNNGKGEGATARALFDYETGHVTNIVVTSRGAGYEDGATAIAYFGSLYGNSGKGIACGEVTVRENVPGGLTKTGPGRLNLAAENTYAGETVAAEGTLAFERAGSYPEGSTLVPSGGAVLMAAAACPPALKVRVPDGADRVKVLTFSDNVPATLPVVTVVNPGPDEWKAWLVGRALKIAKVRGVLMIVR